MKDIKSMLIGFLLATCMFLFMGQTKIAPSITYNSGEGKYQMAATDSGLKMIDTGTGQVYILEQENYTPWDTKYKWFKQYMVDLEE